MWVFGLYGLCCFTTGVIGWVGLVNLHGEWFMQLSFGEVKNSGISISVVVPTTPLPSSETLAALMLSLYVVA